MTNEEKLVLTKKATEILYQKELPPVQFELEMVLVIGLIGQLQLAFRHPANTGPTRQMLEKFVRDLILQIDTEQKEVFQFLMMGFDETHDC